MIKYHALPLIILIVMSSCSGFRSFDESQSVTFDISGPGRVVMGQDHWTGPEDCSAKAYLNKTTDGLMLTIAVRDDSVRTGNPQSYMNDGIELYLDLRPPRTRVHNYYEKGVFQAVILPEPGKKYVAPVSWYPQSYDTEIRGTTAYTQLSDTGYVVQVTLPYSGLSRAHYWPRSEIFLDIAVNDADTGRRESQIMWAGRADDWDHPHNFRSVVFPEDERKKKTRPNILFIFTDQQTLRAMSAMGNPYLRTPAMDGLASQGVRFTQSYCTSPVCSPSRSSLITSRMPHETRVIYNDTAPDSSLENMGEIFRKAGYNTVWAGKWHLPESYPQVRNTPIPGFKTLSFLKPEKFTGRGDDTDSPLADAVVKFIKSNRKEPFLLAVSFHNPHDICSFAANPDAFPAPLNPASMPPLPENFRVSPVEPEFVKDCRERTYYGNEVNLAEDFSPEMWRNYLYQYYRMTERVDREIGKIIMALEAKGLDQNTLIIFTSDHGDGGAAHHWAAKLSFYEESVNVPFIVTWFGKTPANVTDNEHLVSGLDVLPTMLDYAGVDIPEKLEGRSLKTIIEHPDTSWRRTVVSELAPDPNNPARKGRMITDGRFKYCVYSYGERNEQLFDLATDPGEENNLARNAVYRDEKMKLRIQLERWMRRNGDTFMMETK